MDCTDKVRRGELTPAEREKHYKDAKEIVEAITNGDFPTMKDAEKEIINRYIPDDKFSRNGIAIALKRLVTHYRGGQ